MCPQPENPIAPGSARPKVGIVDDDASLRSKVATELKSDFEVLEGTDYESAYKLLQESELDVLLLGLPIESGSVKECTELLGRLDGSEIDTLVIVLSSDDKKSSALKVIDAGSYDYFIKPIDTDVLRHLLERAVRSCTSSARIGSSARKSAARTRWAI